MRVSVFFILNYYGSIEYFSFHLYTRNSIRPKETFYVARFFPTFAKTKMLNGESNIYIYYISLPFDLTHSCLYQDKTMTLIIVYYYYYGTVLYCTVY